MVSTAPLLVMRDVDKRFQGVKALSRASLEVEAGEIMALVGQNGAGKSTLIKVLTGAYRRDAGAIVFAGQAVDFASPEAAQRGGVSTIYQEINLVPFRSVAENIFLGREYRRFGLLDWGRMNTEAAALLRRFAVEIDVKRPLMEFSTAIQQMVAIARAVSFKARLVIMDEPTSSLDEREVAVLFDVMRQLRAEGVAVIFVTHRLDELYQVCDRVTVMRDGRTVTASRMADVDKLQLVSAMLGRDLETVRKHTTGFSAASAKAGGEVLSAQGLRIGRRVRDARVEVKSGQIVGLAGLLGSGRTETARAIFGADPPDAGAIRLIGKEVRPRQPSDAIAMGVGYCSEDRKADGIVPDMSVRENLTLAILPRLTAMGIVDEARQREIVDRFMKRLAIKAASPEQKIRDLSGGNQQKVLLARWLCADPKLLILDEPTRGIDVGAKVEIQALIRELADHGLGVLMISSELEEITEGADRVFVLSDGRTVADLSQAEASADAIMAAMAHGNAASVPKPAVADAPAIIRKGMPVDVAAFFRRYAALTALLVLLAFNFAVTPHFASWQTLNVNLTQVATIVIVSVGMTLVIATAGIDLSVGSLMAISGALAPIIFMSRFGAAHPALGNVLAFVVPVAVAGLFGLFNGWFITRFQVQPIIGTLVMFIAGRGIGQVMTNGNLQPFHNPTFQFIGLGRVLGVPVQVIVMLIMVAAAAWTLRRTLFGRQILAVGGNERAARLSGVPVDRVKRRVYAISGLLAGVAGLIVIAINSSSDANQVGLGMELDAIAAVAVGGTPFTGGQATVVGSLIGALLIQLLRYTLLANGVPDAAALVVKGAIIAGAVWSQQRRSP